MRNDFPTAKRVLHLLTTLIICATSTPAHAADAARGDGVLSLYNLHLNESVEVRYRNSDGTYDQAALARINRVLRCQQTAKVHAMDMDLIELVDTIQDRFGGKQIQVISAYRSPELNRSLRAQGRAVAQKSLHMDGLAMDIRIPGVSTATLRQAAYSLKKGGVGFYPHDGFVHVDVGRFRTW